ncbi:hypothetical protein THOD04_40038 [Vibrio owensii]|nr:hypothetical protein THZB04_10518 [Vibrio owensii]CAH1591821.1 hypothetical protein THOD04_40038 [Vibrio owensii]
MSALSDEKLIQSKFLLWHERNMACRTMLDRILAHLTSLCAASFAQNNENNYEAFS